MQTESQISKSIRDALDKLGIPNWRMNSGVVRVRGGFMRLAPEGTPDILAAPNVPEGMTAWECPKLLWIEVKKPGGKLRPAQLAFGDRMRNRGHAWLCVESFHEVLDWLKENRAR